MKIVIFSLGCKVNQYESQVLARLFYENGFEVSEKLEYADVYIINTCSVTGEADKKSRQAISRVRKFNSEAKIYICGCSSQNSPVQFSTKENVVYVMGTHNKNILFNRVMSDINNNLTKQEINSLIDKKDNFALSSRSRVYVKIQDGCNRFCSYCIVPYLRGRSVSRDPKSILNEVRFASESAEEIVLTGIDISSYGADIGTNLVDLLKLLKQVPIRKRLGSLECSIINKELLEQMKEANVCEHFHISLQSGDDCILKKMNRHYTAEQYAEKVKLIREYFSYAGITTDIIAGFPGETELQHENTKSFVRSIAFSDIHVFPYSQRKGTVAATMRQIPVKERIRRANELIEIKKEFKNLFLEKNIGRKEEVLIEETVDGFGVGYTSNYIKVYVPNKEKGILSVKLENIYLDGLKGDLL